MKHSSLNPRPRPPKPPDVKINTYVRNDGDYIETGKFDPLTHTLYPITKTPIYKVKDHQYSMLNLPPKLVVQVLTDEMLRIIELQKRNINRTGYIRPDVHFINYCCI